MEKVRMLIRLARTQLEYYKKPCSLVNIKTIVKTIKAIERQATMIHALNRSASFPIINEQGTTMILPTSSNIDTTLFP